MQMVDTRRTFAGAAGAGGSGIGNEDRDPPPPPPYTMEQFFVQFLGS
jgi:hypothetical protein